MHVNMFSKFALIQHHLLYFSVLETLIAWKFVRFFTASLAVLCLDKYSISLKLNCPHTAGVCVCVFVSFFLLLSSLKLPLGLMKSQVKKRALLKVFLNSHGCTCFVFACLHVCVLSDRFSVLRYVFA